MRRQALVLAACLLALVACEPSAPDAASTTATASPAQPSAGASAGPSRLAVPGSAAAALAGLPVKGRAPMTGYSRAQFGPAWQDVDHNGCDTRNDILRRDLTAKVLSGSCVVLSGALQDPYTGRMIAFRRGPGTSTAVQIDHVVALGDAWQKGAQQLTPGRRLALANDPLELLAVDGPTNERKGDGDAATWLPPNKAFRCQYVARQVAVKARYHLWVTSAERDAMARVLSTCPGQRLPTGGSPVPTGPPAATQPTATRQPSGLPVVHPGAFCAPHGARGVTSKGTPMVCKLDSKGLRYRWGAE